MQNEDNGTETWLEICRNLTYGMSLCEYPDNLITPT